MIRRIEVAGEGLASPLPMGYSMTDDPIQILEITGLGPVKAGLTATPFATRRGSFFQNASVDSRNIVMSVGLNPNWRDQTISSLRSLLYGYFMTGQQIKMRFFTDDYPVVEIEGIVESCDENMFSKDPIMQISVICYQPDFIDVDYTLIKGAVPNALTDGVLTEYEFDYAGSIEAGFTLRVKHTNVKPAYTGQIVIANKTTKANDIFSLSEVTVDATKYLSLSTIEAARRVRTIAYSDGEVVNLLVKKLKTSPWPMIQPGKNIFSVSAEESNLKFELVYYARYGAL